jgi:hypothetical protein
MVIYRGEGEEYVLLRETAYEKRSKATALNHSAPVFF